MNELDLNRIVETFIRADWSGSSAVASWQAYQNQLRNVVAPLIADLRRRKLVRWFSFLVHDATSGVPTDATDTATYVHLRLEAAPGVDLDGLVRALPEGCRFSRRMQPPNLQSMDSIDVRALVGADATPAWQLLGHTSEWVLALLEAHDTGTPIPVTNVAQFLHYIGNQVQAQPVGIPTP
jgi:hypothetical protein